MFSSNLLRPGSFRRHFMRGVFALFCLFTVILFTGCDLDDDFEINHELNPMLEGTWKTQWDGYIIDLNANTLEYDDGGWDLDFKGTIVGVVNFNSENTAGIIFIQYSKKPTDYDTGLPPDGDYVGIYFKELTGTAGQFAPPVEEYDPGEYRTPAKATLEEAKEIFTAGTMGDFVLYWATYEKQ
ncbi:MAG: hypothetical protein FWG46_02765 [Treponema sp.]|nr:hypothetical protein [Treponema sp.]